VHDLAEVYKKVDSMSDCVMRAIFNNMWDFEYVPIHVFERECRFSQEKIEAVLKRLSDLRLVEKKVEEYIGASFTFKGLSVFSLKMLVKRDVIEMLGRIMGEGKESVVYNALSKKHGEVVVKFHRVGYPSFKKVKEKRSYGTLHYTVLTVRSAKREFTALKRLYGYVSVPKPVDWKGNAVVSELVDGIELTHVRLENPDEVFEMIVDEIKKMYLRGIVHADLSQYNILVSKDGIWIIDFPQFVDVGEKNAEEYLKRDVNNIVTYFRRVYGLKKNLNQVLQYIMDRK